MRAWAGRMARALGSPDLALFGLAGLMVLLVAGTVAQKYTGLYEAQRLFFNAWIVWWGPVPFPAGLAWLALLAAGLTVKLVAASPWEKDKAGIVVAHLGVLLLLLGGAVTALTSVEGTMILFEGETSAVMTEDHRRELVVRNAATGEALLTVPFEALGPGARLDVPGTPLTLVPEEVFRHMERVPAASARDAPLFRPAPPLPEDEANRAGLRLRALDASRNADAAAPSLTVADDPLAAPRLRSGGLDLQVLVRKKLAPLPFSLTLTAFTRDMHPGTALARRYRSDVILRDRGAEWPAAIQMNEPLRLRGYTFYQSSFIEAEGRVATVLAVVRNAGRVFPYLSGLVVGLGLLLHVFLGAKRRPRIPPLAVLALALGLVAAPLPARADPPPTGVFDRLPVLDQGRIKPLSSFARATLHRFAGAEALAEMDATAWLAELLCAPDKAYDRPVFAIREARLADALGLERRRPRLYSYREAGLGLIRQVRTLEALAARPPDSLDAAEREWLDLYDKVQAYGALSRSLSLVFPDFVVAHPVNAKALGVAPGAALDWLALQPHRAALEKAAGKVRNPAPESPRAEVRALLERLAAMDRDRASLAFQVMPPQWDNARDKRLWLSPWGVVLLGQGSPDAARLMDLWRHLVAAWRAGDSASWDEATAAIERETLRQARADVAPNRLLLEDLYNRWEPLRLSGGFYALALLLALASLLHRGNVWFQGGGAAALLAGLLFHAAALAARMLIMGRPPVTNLYASILFVGFLIALAGLLLEARRRNHLGLVVGAGGGAFLQFLGFRYAWDNDTLGMLTAVLDTNFWLATHVVAITVGYAATLLASLFAHVFLGLRLLKPRAVARAEPLTALFRRAGAVALFFTALGTILGGIWADQSWGRFWGWDPKENGALLIVLWLLFVQHGARAGRFGPDAQAALMALASVIVALAWFGVNLLSVGLHAYGFTEGAAAGLAAFAAVEILFALGSYGALAGWFGRRGKSLPLA